MAEDELFAIQPVRVKIPAADMPGRPLKRVQCGTCGDWVQDCRDVARDGLVLCRSCANGRYFELI
jgi:formylmethanofuran dehydrogenase subunit E